MTEDDTLFEDSTGDAADLFENFEESGMEGVVEILNLPEDTWDTGDGSWATAQLMAVEALAAAAGQPAKSNECHYLAEFGASNATTIDKATHDRMLHIVDKVTDKIRKEPEALGLDDEGAKAFLAAGERMRKRVARIAPSGKPSRKLPKGTIRDPETGRLRNIWTGELL